MSNDKIDALENAVGNLDDARSYISYAADYISYAAGELENYDGLKDIVNSLMGLCVDVESYADAVDGIYSEVYDLCENEKEKYD